MLTMPCRLRICCRDHRAARVAGESELRRKTQGAEGKESNNVKRGSKVEPGHAGKHWLLPVDEDRSVQSLLSSCRGAL